MKASDTLIRYIQQCENFRSRAYICPAGKLTCGYGHTQGVTAKTVCNKATAEAWLRQDLAPCETFCSSIKQLDTQGKFDACVDFCFNCGISKFRNSTLYRLILNKASLKDIQDEFKKWKYSNGKPLNGLLKRRIWEANRFAQ